MGLFSEFHLLDIPLMKYVRNLYPPMSIGQKYHIILKVIKYMYEAVNNILTCRYAPPASNARLNLSTFFPASGHSGLRISGKMKRGPPAGLDPECPLASDPSISNRPGVAGTTSNEGL